MARTRKHTITNASLQFSLLLVLLWLAPHRTDAARIIDTIVGGLLAPLVGVWLAPLINLFYDDAPIERDLCYDFVWQFQALQQLDCQCRGNLNMFLRYEGTVRCTSREPACLLTTTMKNDNNDTTATTTCADVQINARAQTETVDIFGAALFALFGDGNPRGLKIVNQISLTFQSVLQTEPPITLDGTASGAIEDIVLGVDTATIQYGGTSSSGSPPVSCPVSVVESVLFDFSCPAVHGSSPARVNVAFMDPSPRGF